MNYKLWALVLFILSLGLNQVTGAVLGIHPINILALVAIPLVFSFHPEREIKLGAKIALIPGVFLLFLYYVVRPFLL